MFRQVNNWWVRLAAALAAAFSLMGLVVTHSPRLAARPAEISADALLTAESAFSPDEIQALFARRGSPLAGYTEVVGEQPLSAGQLVWAAAQHADYGLSPRALLTSLYLEDGWNWTQPGGLYTHLKQIALDLQRNYQAGLQLDASAETKAPGGAKIAAGPRGTAAAYALAQYYAPRAKIAGQARGSLQLWAAAYRDLFGKDPARDSSAKAIATNIPFLRKPFDEPADHLVPVEAFFDHAYPGQINEPNMLRADGKYLPGAHYTACWRGMTCYSGHNAIDYTLPTGTPIYAAAAGVVNYRLDVEGGLVIDHGNGYRTIYWHMDKIIVDWKQPVADGQLLGWSDSRGTSSHPHLHFGLRLTMLSQDVDPYGFWSTNKDPVPGPSKYMWRGGPLADNRSAQMQLFYDQGWNRDMRGYGGDSWYTRSTNQPGASTNWGMWGTYIPAPGKYTVSAYWPRNAENTAAAVYQVWHSGGMTPVKVNQRADGDRFVELGAFQFEEGPIVVILTDLSGDGTRDQRVYFDAVRWQAAQTRTFFPLILGNGSQGSP